MGRIAESTGATIGHIGTDATANASGQYTVTWNLPEVVNQAGVKFKIRVVDVQGQLLQAYNSILAQSQQRIHRGQRKGLVIPGRQGLHRNSETAGRSFPIDD